MEIITLIRLLLIAIWLGAALFFSFAMAPSAFGILPSRDLAGILVNKTLAVINYSGLIIAAMLLAASFLNGGLRAWVERFFLLGIALLCGIGQFVIGYQLSSIRAQVGKPIEELSVDEPLRLAFNSLHQYSVWVLSAAMLAALISFFLIAGRQPKIKEDYGTN